ncbi:MAG: RNA polymerase sigma factor [Candidatus Poribacteria bacterium]
MARGINRNLVEQCRNGDISSFEKLFYLLKDDVYNVAFRVLRNHQDAEDITQEAFVKMWLNLKNFRMESSIRTWVYRITVNLCYDFLKRRGRIPLAEEPVESFKKLPSDENPLLLLTEKELREKVEGAFNMLSPDNRLILTLREIEGLPYKEISEILDCSMDAAKMRVHRARVEFKGIISKYLGSTVN